MKGYNKCPHCGELKPAFQKPWCAKCGDAFKSGKAQPITLVGGVAVALFPDGGTTPPKKYADTDAFLKDIALPLAGNSEGMLCPNCPGSVKLSIGNTKLSCPQCTYQIPNPVAVVCNCAEKSGKVADFWWCPVHGSQKTPAVAKVADMSKPTGFTSFGELSNKMKGYSEKKYAPDNTWAQIVAESPSDGPVVWKLVRGDGVVLGTYASASEADNAFETYLTAGYSAEHFGKGDIELKLLPADGPPGLWYVQRSNLKTGVKTTFVNSPYKDAKKKYDALKAELFTPKPLKDMLIDDKPTSWVNPFQAFASIPFPKSVVKPATKEGFKIEVKADDFDVQKAWGNLADNWAFFGDPKYQYPKAPVPLTDEEKKTAALGNKIAAIKMVRTRLSGPWIMADGYKSVIYGLKDAKDSVDAWCKTPEYHALKHDIDKDMSATQPVPTAGWPKRIELGLLAFDVVTCADTIQRWAIYKKGQMGDASILCAFGKGLGVTYIPSEEHINLMMLVLNASL